jgi:uncharacterized protein (DUF1330 family)
MSVNADIDRQLHELARWYGPGEDGSCPTRSQWQAILERPADQAVSLVNFFRFRDHAAYPEGTPEFGAAISGEEAFGKYAAVSVPTLERVGGRFVLMGPSEGSFVGPDESWHLIAAATYPDLASIMALYTDADYIQAFRHRTAGCADQKVFVCGG